LLVEYFVLVDLVDPDGGGELGFGGGDHQRLLTWAEDTLTGIYYEGHVTGDTLSRVRYLGYTSKGIYYGEYITGDSEGGYITGDP
jgi:hypothetical protein